MVAVDIAGDDAQDKIVVSRHMVAVGDLRIGEHLLLEFGQGRVDVVVELDHDHGAEGVADLLDVEQCHGLGDVAQAVQAGEAFDDGVVALVGGPAKFLIGHQAVLLEQFHKLEVCWVRTVAGYLCLILLLWFHMSSKIRMLQFFRRIFWEVVFMFFSLW